MSQIHVEVSAIIDATPETLYDIVSDYGQSHPAILPKPYFTGIVVEVGGKGAGTRLRVDMNVMGAKRVFHLAVSEPHPGRVLVEADQEAGVVTSFTFDPLADGKQTRVTITTDAQASPGFAGFMEKLINPFITRRIYRQELQLLANYARSRANR